MNSEFDSYKWGEIALKLKEEYPQLTTADLVWRHETKNDFYKTIATEIGVSRRELEEIIDQL